MPEKGPGTAQDGRGLIPNVDWSGLEEKWWDFDLDKI
jgi:hypothetical protein